MNSPSAAARTTNGSSPILSATCRSGTAGWSTASATGNCTISAPTARSSTGPANRSARARRPKLRNGDRIKFGLYELEVMIDEDEEGAARDREGSLSGLRRDDFAMRDAAAVARRSRPLRRPRPRRPVARVPFGTGRVQYADPAGGLRSPGAQSGAVRRHATGPCARARERLPPAPAGGHHSRRLGRRSACRLAPANGATAAAAAPGRRRSPRAGPRQEPPPRPPAAPDTGLAAAFLRGVGMTRGQRCRIRRKPSSDSAPPRGQPSAAFGRP